MKLWEVAKKGWKRLPVRLLTVIVLTILPLNIMSIAVSGMIFSNSTEQIRDSYQRELDSGLTYFFNLLDDMDHYYDNFVSENLDALTLSTSREGDALACYHMLSSLKQIYSYADFDGIFYLYDRKSKRVYLKYNSDRYTVTEVEAMKRKLEKMEEIPESKRDWGLAHLGHYYFVSRINKYTNYQIALYLDAEQVLSGIFGQLATDGTVLYMDNGRDLMQFADGKLTLIEDQTWDDIFENRWKSKNVFWGYEGATGRVGICIPANRYFGGTQIWYLFLILLAVSGIALMAVLWKLVNRRVVRPLERLNLAMQEVENENLRFRIGQADRQETAEFCYLYGAFNRMANEVEASREKDKKMYQAELDNLKLQVNPHMLLNSFNMIYSLAQTKNYEYIQRYSMLLVEYFRYVLRENSSMVPLQKEMDFVVNYVEIQKIRFPNTFSFVYKIDESLTKAYVPPLLIQNFVENSMKYGLIPGRNIEVLINIRKKEDRVLISVTDTGRGMNEEVLETIRRGDVYLDRLGRKHIGIWNCRRRMEMFYGANTNFSIVSKPEAGTQVWIEIPLIYEAEVTENGR